jgi:hypothetical protein
VAQNPGRSPPPHNHAAAAHKLTGAGSLVLSPVGDCTGAGAGAGVAAGIAFAPWDVDAGAAAAEAGACGVPAAAAGAEALQPISLEAL